MDGLGDALAIRTDDRGDLVEVRGRLQQRRRQRIRVDRELSHLVDHRFGDPRYL